MGIIASTTDREDWRNSWRCSGSVFTLSWETHKIPSVTRREKRLHNSYIRISTNLGVDSLIWKPIYRRFADFDLRRMANRNVAGELSYVDRAARSLAHHFQISAVVLIGSYARGDSGESSDIDLVTISEPVYSIAELDAGLPDSPYKQKVSVIP